MKNVIVTGGNGYIGSATCFMLKQNGYQPIILDNFSTSKRNAKSPFPLHEVDVTSLDAVKSVLSGYKQIHGIIHFAALALVGESVEKSFAYLSNNITSSLVVGELSRQLSIPFVVHSSSCSVYGTPKSVPIAETAGFDPLSPYAESKRVNEHIFAQLQKWTKTKFVNLRYFNPAGSLPEENIGEDHDPETHLIPNIVKAFVQKKPFKLYGDRYNTVDGTCIRDFIHVRDLAEAHVRALKALETNANNVPFALNVGTGMGTSVKQVAEITEKTLGGKVLVEICPPRPGDSPQLIADPTLLKKTLGWTPSLPVSQMIKDHYDWLVR